MSRRTTYEPPQARVVPLRAQIAELYRERRRVDDQRRDRAAVRAEIEGFAAMLAADFQARAGAVLARVTRGDRASDMVTEFGLTTPRGLVSLLAGVVGPEALADALLRGLDDRVPEGLDAAARAERLAEIDAELDRLELAEEALIEESERDGAPIQRRADARPEIVLGDA